VNVCVRLREKSTCYVQHEKGEWGGKNFSSNVSNPSWDGWNTFERELAIGKNLSARITCEWVQSTWHWQREQIYKMQKLQIPNLIVIVYALW
jgi:hypothetical protein